MPSLAKTLLMRADALDKRRQTQIANQKAIIDRLQARVEELEEENLALAEAAWAACYIGKDKMKGETDGKD